MTLACKWAKHICETMNTRKATNRLLEMISEGTLDPNEVVMMCVKWMSEDDVKAMCEANEINLEDEEDEEE